MVISSGGSISALWLDGGGILFVVALRFETRLATDNNNNTRTGPARYNNK